MRPVMTTPISKQLTVRQPRKTRDMCAGNERQPGLAAVQTG